MIERGPPESPLQTELLMTGSPMAQMVVAMTLAGNEAKHWALVMTVFTVYKTTSDVRV
jgi:hypothetical protein